MLIVGLIFASFNARGGVCAPLGARDVGKAWRASRIGVGGAKVGVRETGCRGAAVLENPIDKAEGFGTLSRDFLTGGSGYGFVIETSLRGGSMGGGSPSTCETFRPASAGGPGIAGLPSKDLRASASFRFSATVWCVGGG